MNLYIIIHTATRVIRRVTTDASIVLAVDESIIELTGLPVIIVTTDTNTGVTAYLRAGDNSKATQEEIDAITFSPTVDPTGKKTYWKLDSQNKKVPATDDEVDLAKVDAVRENAKRLQKLEMYKDLVKSLATDDTLPTKLKSFFEKLSETL